MPQHWGTWPRMTVTVVLSQQWNCREPLGTPHHSGPSSGDRQQCSELAESNGVHYSPCKLKIKINQTHKLISFPSVGSAVPVRCLPSLVHPSFTPVLGSSGGCTGLCDRPGEDVGTPYQPWETGKSELGRVPKPKAQYWAWKGNRQRRHHSGPQETPVLGWEADPYGIRLGPSLLTL